LQEPPYAATVPAMLEHMAQRWADRDAIVKKGYALTFAELNEMSASQARSLLAAEVGKGCRVGLLMGNSPEWLAAFFAITRIGAIAVPLSTLYQPPELAWIIRHTDLAQLIIAPRYLRHDYEERLEQ